MIDGIKMRDNTNDLHRLIVGNYNLITAEEVRLADFLQKRNLANVNEASMPVHPLNSFYTRIGKRFLDIIISAVALLITLPLNGLFAICTYFDVGRPILYRQTRIGKDGKPFILVKFRNMNENKDENGHLLPASQRVTKFGHFMRKFSLDELLNFWSILKGDMSIIGPRPMPVFVYERMSERHKMRNAVRPGLECPRVITNKVSVWQEGFENAIWYVENISFRTDLKLLFMLVCMVFDFKTRAQNAASTRSSGYFIGYDDKGYATSKGQYEQDFPTIEIKMV